jgi:phosphoribosylaminoimidazolecarboxamide formyltransferase/IMP cyclohydrolase
MMSPMNDIKIKRALIAVYDKTGITEFARALVDEFGIEILSTGGTAKHLKDAGIPVTMVESVTGFPEMLDGRVKTLHPKIHAGILADRDNPNHMRQLQQHGIQPIDMVVVNLYPFEKTVADPNCTFDQAIEMIDIGGPCMLRAAAKNHKHVVALTKPEKRFLHYLRFHDQHDHDKFRQSRGEHAREIYWMVSRYDAAIALWLSQHPALGEYTLKLRSLHLEGNGTELRYGENPHQKSNCFENASHSHEANVVSGFGILANPESKCEMSFNNYIDGDAALSLVKDLSRAGSALVGPASCRSGVGPASCRSGVELASSQFDRQNAGLTRWKPSDSK